MNIAIVHNCYGGLSGEEVVVFNEIEQLKNNGRHNIYDYIIPHHKTPKSFIDKVLAFFSGIFNFVFAIKFFLFIRNKDIDIVHFHNIYPWISPSAILVCQFLNVPYVITLHNYRAICPSATLFFKGKVYLKGLEKGPVNVFLDNVFHDYFKSFGYWLRFISYKKISVLEKAHRVICVSDFVREYHSRYVVANYITVYNPLSLNVLQSEKNEMSNSIFLPEKELKVGYLGRISGEKGIDVVLDAAKCLDNCSFYFAGEKDTDFEFPDEVYYLGRIDRNSLEQFFSSIDVLVVPSLWYETFGLIVLESIAFSTPVIVSSNGALPEIVSHFKGCKVFGTSSAELAETLVNFDSNEYARHAKDNISILSNVFSGQSHVNKLLDIYENY